MVHRDVFHEASVVAGGVRFHYATAGRGPLILLLHGFPERWFSWRAQIPALAAEGYRVVAPDLRGYGLSDKPASGYEITDLAQDVVCLIHALGEASATVIGHDWGGAITWEAAARYPACVARCAVLNCPHPAVMREVALHSWDQFRRSWYMLFFNLPWLPERLIARDRGRALVGIFRRASVHPEKFTPEVLEAFRDSVATPDDVSPMLAYYRRSVRRALGSGLPPYPLVRQPTLLLWGERDTALSTRLIAPHTRYASDLTLRRVPNCGHFIQQECADTVNALLATWLRASRPSLHARAGVTVLTH
jgi:pimeloyl-ACP methyl ester carboxylesterase